MNLFKPRSIRFLELYSFDGWTLKVYSIAKGKEFIAPEYLVSAKKQLSNWLANSSRTTLDNYKIASLILHEGKEGCFAIINWWVDENMLQHLVYLAETPSLVFEPYSEKNAIIACVWELEVIWFERNAWVKHVLMNNHKPDFQSYLMEQLKQENAQL